MSQWKKIKRHCAALVASKKSTNVSTAPGDLPATRTKKAKQQAIPVCLVANSLLHMLLAFKSFRSVEVKINL